MPPEELGTAYFRIRADTRAFAGEARSGVQSALRGESERATVPVRATVNRGQAEQTIKRDLGGAVRSAATYIGGIFAAEQVFNFAKGAIGDAAAVQKAQESIRSEYGKSGEAVDRFAHGQATSFGISAAASVTASAKIGALLDNMHIAPARSAEMSVGLQKVVGSLSQIKDVDPTAILNRLNTSLATGSTRGLRDLGIALDANTVKTYAFSHGIGTVTKDTAAVTEKQLSWKKAQDAVLQLQDKGQRGTAAYAVAVNAAARAHEAYNKAVAGSEKPLTVVQKDQALYGLVTQNLPKYLDEAKKHSGDYANQVKVLSAEWANAQAELGEKLLPVATSFIGVIRTSVDFIGRYRTEFDALALGIAAASAAYATIKAAQFGYNLVTEAGTRVQKLFSGELMTSQGWMSKQAIQDRISVASKTAYTTAIAAGATEQEAQTAATQAGTVAQDELNASMLANPIGIVVVSVAALAFGLYELYEHSATARRIMNETWADLKKYGGEALHWITHEIQLFVNYSEGWWHRWGHDVKEVASAAFTYVKREVMDTLHVIEDVVHLFGDVIHGRWGKIWGDVKQLAYDAIKAVLDRFGTLPERGLAILKHLGTDVVNESKALLRDAENLGKELLHGIISGIEHAPGNIASALKDKVGGALSDVGSAFGIGSPSRVFAEQIGQPISDGIVLGAQSLHDDLRNQMVNQLQSLQSTYGPRWQQNFHDNVGSPIAQGVVQGASGLRGSLTSTVIGAVQGALNTARAKFGIHSPSSVWATQLGQPIAEGIVHGMGGLEQMLVNKVQSAASAAMAAGGGIGGPSGSAAVGANQRLGYQMMLQAGWPASQWGALQALWNRESGWNQYAKNPSSGAFGIPQELGHAVSSAYMAGDVAAQIEWGLCVPLHTRILTRRGWLRHDEVVVGDETIGYNPETGCSEWTPVLAVHHMPGTVMRFGTAIFSAECTANHRWLMERVEPRDRRTVMFEHLSELAERTWRDRIVLARPANTESSLDVTVQEAALLGWLAGEGSFQSTSGDPKDATWFVSQAKTRNFTAIDEACGPTDRWSRYGPMGPYQVCQWRLSTPYARDLIARAGHPRRDAVQQVLRMSTEQRYAWLEAVIAAEGWKAEPDGRLGTQLFQAPGQLADAMVIAIYLSGYRPSIYRRDRSDQEGRENSSPEMTISFCKGRTGRPDSPGYFSEVVGKQDTWCVTTTLGTWTAQQGTNVFLTGNSYIRGRYGSPAAAWAHEEQVGWYQGGGVAPGAPGQASVGVLHGGEVVFTPEQMGLLSRRSLQIGQVVIQGGGAGEFLSELDAIARSIG